MSDTVLKIKAVSAKKNFRVILNFYICSRELSEDDVSIKRRRVNFKKRKELVKKKKLSLERLRRWLLFIKKLLLDGFKESMFCSYFFGLLIISSFFVSLLEIFVLDFALNEQMRKYLIFDFFK